jgi:formylmethanofuran dehydrogenase subunit E
MLRSIIYCGFCVSAAFCLAQEPVLQLPQPHYHHKKASDPAWLEHVVQLHGHLGPWVVAGARLGMAGARAVDAKGHFDVEVTCEGPFAKPPQSCFLDGIQLGTGATLGKRTIAVVEAKQLVVKIRNPRTKRSVEVRPTRKLMDILEPPEKQSEKTNSMPPNEEQVEQLARDIAAMPDKELLTTSRP